jgi:hypothetical protein
MLPVSLLVLAMTASNGGPIALRIPVGETSRADLAPTGLLHHEALRIDRDFGKPEFDLVIDAWSSATDGGLADVRLWWAKTTDGDRRSPLSHKTERYVDVETRRTHADRIEVRVRGGARELSMEVELDAAGRVRVYTDVVTADGREVHRCRALAGRLLARRVLGIPVGVGALALECIDARGRRLSGRARLRRTPAA